MMKKLKILIAEDISNLEIDLQNRLLGMGFKVIGLVSSPKDALSILEQEKADLVIMDTYSELETNGFETAKIIQEKYSTPTLFLSAEDKLDFAKYIDDFGPCVFINKPTTDNELRANINMVVNNENPISGIAKDNYANVSPYIFVRADYRLNKIRVSDLYYLEAKKDYVTIHTSDNVYTVHATMKEMIKVLPSDLFIRTHRSYIVNIDKVFSIKYPDLVIENKMKTIPIGGLYRKSFFEKINIV